MELGQLAVAVIRGDAEEVLRLTKEDLSSGVEAKQILDNGLIAGMNVVGEKFKNGEFFLPEVLVAARAMKGGMEILRPELSRSGVKPVGKVVIGTVKGDLHDIGKNIVVSMLEGAGFQVFDLGVDVGIEKFTDAIRENSPHILGMSALLTTTMTSMKDIVKSLEEKNLRDKVRVIVGGAPLSKEYANDIGANGYAPDATSAVSLCKELIGE